MVENQPPCSDNVLVGDTEEVTFLIAELDPGLGDALHAGGHVVVALGLLGQLGPLNQFILVGHVCLCFCGFVYV